MSDKTSSIRILDDAKRLNMMDGHFVWLWIDTAAVINVKNSSDEIVDEMSKRIEYEEVRLRRNVELNTAFQERLIRRLEKSNDIEEMHVNYFLRNDQYLLFNRKNYVAENSKLKDRRSDHRKQQKKDSAGSVGGSNGEGELPAGLLSLKPLPVKADRHLVKGVVRLLISVLKDVLDRSPSWMIRNLVTVQNNGCWKNVVIKESSFIADFGK